VTHQTDHENTAENAAVTPPPALTTEGRLRARVQTLEEDAERNQGLAKVGARCMREGHQGLIESGRATVEGHRFALSVALDLGTGATWDAIHERVKGLRRMADETATETPTDGPCAQHPTAPVIGGICGGCTQYPADFPARRPPMDPVHILGIWADDEPAAGARQDGAET
jgi:hypothetical protein